MKRKISLLLALVMVLVMALSACGTPANNNSANNSANNNNTTPEPAQDKHLNVAIYWNATLDTMNSWGGWWTMRYGVGETLLTMDKDMNLVECLADSYTVEDPQTFKFHIRQGLKGTLPSLRLVHGGMDAQAFLHLPAHPSYGIKACKRLLKDHAYLITLDLS